jgi:hypothetical protein
LNDRRYEGPYTYRNAAVTRDTGTSDDYSSFAPSETGSKISHIGINDFRRVSGGESDLHWWLVDCVWWKEG